MQEGGQEAREGSSKASPESPAMGDQDGLLALARQDQHEVRTPLLFALVYPPHSLEPSCVLHPNPEARNPASTIHPASTPASSCSEEEGPAMGDQDGLLAPARQDHREALPLLP